MHGEREAAHHISIGRFAGLTGNSANTLRRYDEAGLLSPAFADPLTGYRLYSIEQLDDGILIRLLRALDVPLREVKSLMVAGGPDEVRAALAHHRERIGDGMSSWSTSLRASMRPSRKTAACCRTSSSSSSSGHNAW